MALVSKPHDWSDNENPAYTDLNSNENTIYNEFNGNIDNANIKAGAGIEYSKLDLTGEILETDLGLTDVTTADVSITKHGFVPKAPSDATKFLRGDATWAVPSVASVTAEDTLGSSITTSATNANITGASVALVLTQTSNVVLIATISGYAPTACAYSIQWHDGSTNVGVETRGDLQAGNKRLPMTVHTILTNKAAGSYTFTLQHRSQDGATACTAETIDLIAFTLPA